MNAFFSIDIGGTFIKYALIDHSGNIQIKGKVKTPQEKEPFLEAIVQLIKTHQDQIKAVAISTPGKVDTQEGIIYYGGALGFLDGLEIKKHIYEEFELPCSVLNDGKAAALAELWLGGLKGISNGITLTLGTGIGGGIIINGDLYEGTHFQAGEFSFGISHYDASGIKELVAEKGSAVGFIQEASRRLGFENLLDGEAVFKELEKQNPLIYPLFEQFCRQIAVVIITIQGILDMEKVTIGGGISAQPLLINEITTQYKNLRTSFPLMNMTLQELPIEACHFKNEANLLGAVYQHLVNNE